MRHNLALDTILGPFAGEGAGVPPGAGTGWNDADMLLTSSHAAAYHLSESQSRAQFSMWAVMSAPLLISADVGQARREARRGLA